LDQISNYYLQICSFQGIRPEDELQQSVLYNLLSNKATLLFVVQEIIELEVDAISNRFNIIQVHAALILDFI
jgi:hypothetical protein